MPRTNKTSRLRLLILTASLGAACASEPTSHDAQVLASSEGPLYAVQHNINAPEGRLVYVSLLSSLDAPGDALDAGRAIEISGYAAMQAFDGALFIAENESATVTRWEVDAEGKATPGAKLSFANEAVSTFWNENFLYLDRTTAWYANEATQEIVVWDPSRMEITGRIPVTGLDMSELPASFEGLARVDDRVFMPVTFTDWEAYDAHLPAVVVVFSVSEARVVDVWQDERCAIPMSALPALSVADDGTFYIVGDAGWSAWNHGATPDAPAACALRVLPGADGFDPDWSVSLDGKIPGYGDMTSFVMDDTHGRVFVDLMKQPESPFANVDELSDWQIVPGNTRRVACDAADFGDCAFADEGIDGSLHWFSAKIDGRVLMTSLREANNDTDEFGRCAVYDMTAQGPKELFETHGFISNIVRVR